MARVLVDLGLEDIKHLPTCASICLFIRMGKLIWRSERASEAKRPQVAFPLGGK